MNKYFKYILLSIALFFIGSMRVEAANIKCTYNWTDSSGKTNTVTMNTKDNGQTWYRNTGLRTYYLDENVIDGLQYSVSSKEDCPEDNSINMSVQEYNNPNNDKIHYKKYTVDNATPTLRTGDDEKTYEGASKKEQALINAGGSSSSSVNAQQTGKTSCNSLFSGLDDEINKIFTGIKVVVPILVIVFSSLDFAKAIFGGSDDDLKKSQVKFAKRLIIAFIFFLLPTIMAFLMDLMNVIYNGGNFDCLIID